MIKEGDAEANYAHYCLQRLHILPSVYINLTPEERAFVVASIDIHAEEEKKQAQEAGRK